MRSRSAGRVPRARLFRGSAPALALVLGASCGTAGGGSPPPAPPPHPPEPVPTLAAEPTVRVGVAWGEVAIEVGGAGRWWIHEAGSSRPIAVVEPGETWRVVRLPFETTLRVERPDGWLSEPHAAPLAAASLAGGGMSVRGTPYPGAFEFRAAADGSVTAVNVVPMEAYLEGVVARELGRPGAGAMDALKAQAVAARTYALKRMGSRSALGFDVYGSVEDQAYAGLPEPGDSLAVRAVGATRGEALVWNGSLVEAFYHSTCGGHTARVEETFDLPPAPYLTAVSDEREDGTGYWCQESRYFRWTASWEGAQLDATVRRNLPRLVPLPPEGAGELRNMELVAPTPEGRATALRVETSTGRYLIGEDAIRRLFSDPEGRILRSTLFLFRPAREGGRLVGLTLVGGGWGHGVGMCQVGAMARARAGQDYRHILETYYNGASVTRVY